MQQLRSCRAAGHCCFLSDVSASFRPFSVYWTTNTGYTRVTCYEPRTHNAERPSDYSSRLERSHSTTVISTCKHLSFVVSLSIGTHEYWTSLLATGRCAFGSYPQAPIGNYCTIVVPSHHRLCLYSSSLFVVYFSFVDFFL